VSQTDHDATPSPESSAPTIPDEDLSGKKSIGNYVLLERIGAGGMGVVYKAWHQRMKRIVAVKVLGERAIESPHAIERFRREIEVIAQLEHPNIVTAFDADVIDDQHFLAMQYIDGQDLGSRIRSGEKFTPTEVVRLIGQAAQGLEYAHQRGIIHRDIKPSNLILDASGTLKVLDLGLARILPAPDESTADRELTRDGVIMGTIDFMAPEQATNPHAVDGRCDIYSLGCTMFYLLIGQPPYQADTKRGVLFAHRDQPIPSMRKLRSDVPASLDVVLQRMIAKHPEDRFASMTEVIAALHSRRERTESYILQYAALVLVIVLPFIGWWMLKPPPAPIAVTRPEMSVAKSVVSRGGRVEVVIDGRTRRFENANELPPDDAPVFMVDFTDVQDFRDDDLARLRGLNDLGYVNLSRTPVTHRGLQYLIGLPNLHGLFLDEVALDESCVDLLMQLKSLTELTVRNSGLTAEQLKGLRETLSDCHIETE